MQVFGLPRHVIRAGALASRIAASFESGFAAIRLDAVRRWQRARAAGLSADDAAEAVGVSRATLYRWAKRPEPLSRRPRRVRKPQSSPALAQAVEELRGDNPMWGKRKLAWLIRREGFTVSTSTVGRILKSLMQRGLVMPVPTLRRKPGGRRFRLIGQDRHARRLPRASSPPFPDRSSRSTPSSSTSPPERPSNTSPHTARWQSGPSPAWRAGQPPISPPSSSTRSSPKCPSPSPASRSTAAPNSWPASNKPAATKASTSSCCRQSGPNSTAPSNAATVHGDTSSMPSTTCPTRSTGSSPSSTPLHTDTIITDRTTLSTDKPRPSI